ncbi:hypothetical protein N3K66_007138 [Trichothecium roseum]|uniref:Uncharacterized protein n=1 Tax=Trichothecium roseum TaxID=47278 RepID=A0ACC0UY02_9HYPO|nr:hypothetical protein N3K66_007138 [Trichothecium roseum]
MSDPPSDRGPRGAFVVLEGLDRSGKTTQVKLLEQRFVEEGRPVKVMRFPDRTTVIGQMIDGYLKSDVEMDDHVIHLLFSANRWEAAKTMETLLSAGTSILCDRYSHSGVAYSAAKRNPSLPLSWARAPERGLPRPDLVLFLDLPASEARRRGGFGEEVYEREGMQRRVREIFLGMSDRSDRQEKQDDDDDDDDDKNRPDAGEAANGQGRQVRARAAAAEVTVVDAAGSVEDVAENIWAVVKKSI